MNARALLQKLDDAAACICLALTGATFIILAVMWEHL